MTAADNDGGNADASLLSIVLALSKLPDQDNNSSNGNADAGDASGKKTLVSNTAMADNNGGNADAGTLSVVLPKR